VVVGDICWDSEALTLENLKSSGKPVIAYLPGLYSNTSQPFTNSNLAIGHTLSKPLSDTEVIQKRVKVYKQAKIPIAKKIDQIPYLIHKVLTEQGARIEN
jgi:succinyl-CoA synthetase alpha subunit